MESKISFEHYDFCNSHRLFTLLYFDKTFLDVESKNSQEFQLEFCSEKQLNSADVMNSKILFGHYDFVYTVGCVLTKIYFLDDLSKQVGSG